MMNREQVYPIRILHVIGKMDRGGAEAMIMNLYRYIDRTKVQFDFVENTYDQAAFDDEIRLLGGRIYNCPHFTGKNYFQYKHWWNKFFIKHKDEYQIIHGHIGSTAAIYLKIAKQNGLFTIAHSHNTNSSFSISSSLYRIMSYRTRYIADFFFGCSDLAGQDRFGKRVYLSDKYLTFRNAIDTNAFAYNNETRIEVRKNLGVSNDTILIGHIGRLHSQKNHLFLINVFSAIYNKNTKCKLILVGEGPNRDRIEGYAKQLGVIESVIFTGVRSDVNQLIQGMDCFVFPSLYEGLPVVLVEAQVSGLICVISDKVPSEAIITDGLVTTLSLEQSADEWAEHIISRFGYNRYNRADEVKAQGFDVNDTAKWIEDFYLSIYKKNEVKNGKKPCDN